MCEEDVVYVLPEQETDEEVERKQNVADVELGQKGAPGPAEGKAAASENL